MALPQTVDQTSLNLSGKPAIATAPTTTITTPQSTGLPQPRVEDVSHEVSPLLGGLFSGLLAYGQANRANKTGTTATGAQTGQQANTGNLLGNLIKAATSGKTTTGGGSTTSGGSGTGSGNLGGMTDATSVIQTNASGDYINTKTGETVTPMGNNTFRDSKGNVLDENGNQIGPNFGGGSGTAITTDTGNTATSIGNGYYADQNNNVYDSNGVLIYQNPSAPSTGTQTEPSGGGYDVAQDQYYQSDNGDIYNGLGDLVLSFSNGYYYEPDTGNFYDANLDPVSTDFNAYTDYFNIPVFDSSGSDASGIDWSGYGTDWTTTWVKDGGSIKKGGLPTPLFANGGNVKRFADGGTSFTDQVVANQVSSPSTTSTSLTDSGSSGTNILDSLLNFASSNPTLTGAGLGALLTAALNQGSSIPTNKGVDMTALGTLKPRTTTVGPARYVPYSEYGTPTTPADYSTLYQNLGVSPFNTPAPTTAPTTTPTSAPVTTPTSAPVTGGLPSVAPSTGTPTAPASIAPQYFQDNDGNVYDANGDLVYDATSGSMTTTPSVATTTAPSVASSPLATGTLQPTGAGDAYYSYGTPVDPSSILKSKKGGLAKMADGGATTEYNPTQTNTLFDLQSGWTTDDLISAIKTLYPNATQAMIDSVLSLGTGYAGTPMSLRNTIYNYAPDLPTGVGFSFDPIATPTPTPTLTDKELIYGTGSTEGNYYDGLYHPNYTGISTGLPSEETITPGEVYTPSPYERNDVSVVSTGTSFPPIMYNQGMPTQGPAMPTQGGLMPQQGPLMPTQGPAMPTQTPFSDSPTFRFSGANNPLLTGLRQNMPNQQPFMLMPNGTFAPREEISTSRQYAEGGDIGPNIPFHTNANIPNLIKGRVDYRQGSYVEGPGDGQSDDIPAMLADGEYVIDAETVAQLGNGSNKAGAKMLDEFRKNIRAHKRSAPHDKIPPKSKSALAYLKGAK